MSRSYRIRRRIRQGAAPAPRQQLLTLPDELIDNVLSFLDGTGISATAMACKTLSSRAPAHYERLIAQAPPERAIDAAAWRENGFRTVTVHNFGASYTGLTYFDFIWRYGHWRKRAGLQGWSKATSDKIKTRHTGDVCPVLHSWRPFGVGYHAMWPQHEAHSHARENCVDLLGLLDADYVPVGRRGCSTLFVCAPYQANPLVEAILRKHSLNEGFIVNTDWAQEETSDQLQQSLAKQKMSDQSYDRALIEQEERSHRMPYELAASTQQSRQKSYASDTDFLDQRADELHDRLNAMQEESALKSEKLHALELEFQECKQLSERVDASSRLDALNGMDDRLREAFLTLQHEEQMLHHMRRRLEENNYNLSRGSEALQREVEKFNAGTERLTLYRDQLEAAQQHSESTAKKFKRFLEVERGTRATELERRRVLAAKREEEEKMNVKRLARQLRAKDPEQMKAEAVTNIIDVSAENHKKQQRLDERRTYEKEMKRVEQASGVTDIAQVVDRYEHIHESAAALHEGRRQVEQRKATLVATLKQCEKTRADMELMGVNRDSTIDDSIAKLENRLDVQEGRVDEARRRLASIVPLLQGIGSGCRTMQRMLGLSPLDQLLTSGSEEKTMLTEVPPSRPGTAPSGSDDALRAFNSRRQIALNASDATLEEGSFSRDPEEVARYEMDRAELDEFAESVDTLARIESELTRGALRNYLKPRQPGEPMTRAEAAAARDADRRGLQSNPDNLRVLLDADGLVTFGKYLGGLDMLDDGSVPDRPEDEADKELTFNRFSQWKVNPVVHPSRGVLGYARTPVRDGKAPTGAPVVLANGSTPPSSKRRASIAGERRGSVRMEGSTSLPTLAPGTVPVGEDQIFSKRASVPRSEPRKSVRGDLGR